MNKIDLIKRLYNTEHIINGLSYKQIQQKHNIPRGTWNYYSKKLDLKYDGRKYRCADNYFDIFTHDSCYILGFLYADGCLTKEGRIAVALHSQDIEVVEFIKSKICPSAPIHIRDYNPNKRHSQCIFRIRSKQIYNKLKSLGFCINKTHTESNIFNNIPDEFKTDFIRGYTDGDGHVRYDTNCQYGVKLGIVWCNGTASILEDIKLFLEKEIDVCGKITEHTSKNIYYKLSYYKNLEVLKICKLLYQNNFYSLSRKKENALNTISYYESQNKSSSQK